MPVTPLALISSETTFPLPSVPTPCHASSGASVFQLSWRYQLSPFIFL